MTPPTSKSLSAALVLAVLTGCAAIAPEWGPLRAIRAAMATIETEHVTPVDRRQLEEDCLAGIRAAAPETSLPSDATIETAFRAVMSNKGREALVECVRSMLKGLSPEERHVAGPLRAYRPSPFVAKRVDGVLYFRIPWFAPETLQKVGKELEQPAEGAIIDLRSNEGGLLNVSVGVAAAFLAPGAAIVETRGRTPARNMRLAAIPSDFVRARETNPFDGMSPVAKTMPILVVVDATSDGGAEIVAAALQDHRRALVIGTRTNGAGKISTMLGVPGSGIEMKVPTAHYFRGDGRRLSGVEPDRAFRFEESFDEPLSDATIRKLVAEFGTVQPGARR